MTAQSVFEVLDSLRNCVDPRNGEVFRKEDSCLADPAVRRSLNELIKKVNLPDEPATADISDAIIESTCTGLRELGYTPCAAQLVKVFIGSRSIADRSIRGLHGYKKFRGVYSRPQILARLVAYGRQHPEVLAESSRVVKKTVKEAWRTIDFFRTDNFDKLEEEKYDELKVALHALGLHKQHDRLPEYMVRARITYPRAYEPWGKAEQALLIEAMCYTNDLARLAILFARSEASVERMGQRLIFQSKEKQRA